MKKLALALIVIGCSLFSNLNARGDISFSAGISISSPSEFYEPLEPYGSWVTVANYGRCWHPVRVERDWRPYTVGHWEWTDVGWYWVSDEPWAWACYHYGSWVFDPNYGWVWIPGTEWAPAWVNWRQSDDYIGWAPCGPGGVVLDASFFVFTGVNHFHDRFRPASFVYNDRRIFDRTRRVGSFRRETRNIDGERQRVVYNPGPSVTTIQKATGQQFTPVPIREAVNSTPLPQGMRRRETFNNAEPSSKTQRRDNQRNLDNQRTFESQGTRRQLQPNPQPAQTQRENVVPQAPAPTGREPRIYRENRSQPEATPQRPAQNPTLVPQRPVAPTPAPVVPERPPTPTGRERGYENRNEPPPAAPPSRIDRPTNPTGRERGNSAPPPEKAGPPSRPETPPARPAAPPQSERGREQERDKDKDHP